MVRNQASVGSGSASDVDAVAFHLHASCVLYTSLYLVTNWYILADFQTLNCRYSFGIQPMWPKFCMALITRYDLFS